MPVSFFALQVVHNQFLGDFLKKLIIKINTAYYFLIGDLVRVISDQEVTLEMLTELDRLVQLIESPIFTCKYLD